MTRILDVDLTDPQLSGSAEDQNLILQLSIHVAGSQTQSLAFNV